MTDIQKIHNLHMDISYNQNHQIYRYVEKCADKSKSFKFDRNFIISINRFCRYDMSIHLLKKSIFPTKESFSTQFQKSTLDSSFVSFLVSSIKLNITKDLIVVGTDHVNKNHDFDMLIIPRSLNDCYDDDLCEMECPLNKHTNEKIRELIKEYESFIQSNPPDTKSIHDICRWVYDKYDILRVLYDNTNPKECIVSDDNSTFISMMLFLGMLEWFHLLIIRMMIDNLKETTNNRCLLISGEDTTIEYEHMDAYSLQDIRMFFTSEYSSHATIYLIDNHHISMFDPDRDDKKNYCSNDNDFLDHTPNEMPIDKLSLVLEKEYVPMDINPSIQTLTDDQYCIFHCIDFILKIIEMIDDDYSIQSLEKFTKYINGINKIMKISDVRTFVKTLDAKANFFIEKNLI